MTLIYFIIQVLLFFSPPYIQKIFTTHHLFVPEAWSFYSNADNFNIADPDSFATYYQSIVYLNKGESINVYGNLSNYKYYSLQVYDFRAITLGNINFEKVMNGQMNLTINNIENSTYELNTINLSSNSTIFIIVFRVYDFNDEPLSPHEMKPNLKLVHSLKGILPTAKNFVDLRYNWLAPNCGPVKFPQHSTRDNNFLKPELNSYFYNDDAHYLIANIQNPNKSVGVIVTGILPTEDQVLYTSINIGTSSFPMVTISGAHYGNNQTLISYSGRAGLRHIEIKKRYKNIANWNMSYTIYIGLDLDHIHRMGGDPATDLYLLYPLYYISGKPYSNVMLTYRHLMPHQNFNQSISKINKSFAYPEVCANAMEKYYPKTTFIYN